MEGQSRRAPLIIAINGRRGAEWTDRRVLPVRAIRLNLNPALPQQCEHALRPTKMQRADRDESRPTDSEAPPTPLAVEMPRTHMRITLPVPSCRGQAERCRLR